MSNYILVGLVCFLVGFSVGVFKASNYIEKLLKRDFFELDGKIYKVVEFKPEEKD